MPSAVPARANLWALRSLGVRVVIGPCAAGSLEPTVHPGDFVVLDQLVDRTWGRADTFYDAGLRHHVSFADPYCPVAAAAAVSAAQRTGVPVHEHGTVVVVQGPRFSTRAESAWFRAQGWDVVNMTQYPEAALARELGICFANISLVTDYDAGVEDDDSVAAVDMETVLRVMNDNVDRVRGLLMRAVPSVPLERACHCGDGALDPGSFTG
jgi:5'-methylthioadenosine phosphorylase